MEKGINNLEEKVNPSKRKNRFFSKVKRTVGAIALAAALGGVIGSCANPMASPINPKSNPINPTPTPTQTVYPIISGVLQDDEAHANQNGKIRFYDSNLKPLAIQKNYSGTVGSISVGDGDYNEIDINTGNNGHFDVELAEQTSSLSSIVLEAESTDNTRAVNSYTRTITLNPNQDNNPINTGTDAQGEINAVRVVPYTGEYSIGGLATGGSGSNSIPPDSTDIQDFKAFVKDMEKYVGLSKSNIKNVEIFQYDTFNSSEKFTESDLTNIENKVIEWNNVITNNGTNGRSGLGYNTLPFQSYGGESWVWGEAVSGIGIEPATDYEIVCPSSSLDGNIFELDPAAFGTTYILDFSNNTETTRVDSVSYISGELSGTMQLQATVSHELGNSIMNLHDTTTLSQSQSIMNPYVNILTSPTNVDKKAALITYEETYNAGESIDNILGTSF